MLVFIQERKCFLDRYYKLYEIGRGATATVYKAYDKTNDMFVAMKCSEDRMLMLKEYHFIKNANCPGIPKVYEYFEDGDMSVIIMEYIHGTTLKTLIKEKCADVRILFKAMFEIAVILLYMHEIEKAYYLDLKPANIILSGQKAYLVDFGSVIQKISKSAEGCGTVYGTKRYASPELWIADSVIDEKSDVYGFGCVIDEIINNFNVKNKKLSSVVKRCKQKKAVKRYASMREVIVLYCSAISYVGVVYTKKVQYGRECCTIHNRE